MPAVTRIMVMRCIRTRDLEYVSDYDGTYVVDERAGSETEAGREAPWDGKPREAAEHLTRESESQKTPDRAEGGVLT